MIKFRLEAVLMIRKSAKNPDLHSAILNTWRRPVFKSSYVPVPFVYIWPLISLMFKNPQRNHASSFQRQKRGQQKMQKLDTLIIFIIFVCFFDISEARRGFPIFIEGFGDFLCRFFVSPVGEYKVFCSSSYSKT